MAFWKIYGKSWFLKKIQNMMNVYRKYLYDEWYSKLSPEAKKLEDERLERERDEDEFYLKLMFGGSRYLASLTGNKRLMEKTCELQEVLNM